MSSRADEQTALEACLPRLATRLEATLQLNAALGAGQGSCRQATQTRHYGSAAKDELQELLTLADAAKGGSWPVAAVQWAPGSQTALAACHSEAPGGHGEHMLACWQLPDAVRPQRKLAAPFPLSCFALAESGPVAGGCSNGAVVLWPDTHTGEPSCVETAHHSAVTALQWLPGWSIAQRKFFQAQGGLLLVSLAADSRVVAWGVSAQSHEAGEQEGGPLQLKPLLATELQHNRAPLAADRLLPLCQDASFQLLLGCADGRIFALSREAMEEIGGGKGCAVVAAPNGGSVRALAASPCLPGVLLLAGEWACFLCRMDEGVLVPLLELPPAPEGYTAGAFSSTRAGVLMLARCDGQLEAWDLLASASQPAAVNAVSAAALTCLAGSTANGGLLAAGDARGAVRILQLPSKLSAPVEDEVAQAASALGLD